ncbi:MAG: hypothetical protein HS117_18090 [Verrucomicrobiaceae bacterium]|nr:hypothetical protein [Verrucomicrobiaceae bacterium]
MSNLPLPQGWKDEPLSTLVERLESGVSVNSEDKPCAPDEFGILKTSCVNGGKFDPSQNKVIVASEVVRAALNPRADSVLISRMNTFDLVGETAYVGGDFPNLFVPDRLWQTVLRSGLETSTKWLSFVVQSPEFRAGVSRAATGTSGSMKNISQGSYLAIRTRIPPPPQQRRIAEILTTVDEAMEQTEALVGKLEQLKAGLMHDLFTRGVTPDGHLRPTRQEAPHLYHETPLGWLPKEWEIVSLQTEIGIGHGFAFSGEFFSDVPPGSVLLTPGNFHRDGGLYFTAGNTKYFQGPIPKETILEHGEMVTVMTDLSPQTLILGRFALVETTFPVLHNQRVGRVNLKNKTGWEWNYLCHALNNESLRRQIIVEATGTTVRHTSPGRILSKQIARPPRGEQRTSLSIMSAMNQQIVLEKEVFAKLRQQKQGLMQDLLTGRVRVDSSKES